MWVVEKTLGRFRRNKSQGTTEAIEYGECVSKVGGGRGGDRVDFVGTNHKARPRLLGKAEGGGGGGGRESHY